MPERLGGPPQGRGSGEHRGPGRHRRSSIATYRRYESLGDSLGDQAVSVGATAPIDAATIQPGVRSHAAYVATRVPVNESIGVDGEQVGRNATTGPNHVVRVTTSEALRFRRDRAGIFRERAIPAGDPVMGAHDRLPASEAAALSEQMARFELSVSRNEQPQHTGLHERLPATQVLADRDALEATATSLTRGETARDPQDKSLRARFGRIYDRVTRKGRKTGSHHTK